MSKLLRYTREIIECRAVLPYNGDCRATGYDAKRWRGINVVDPGAVPGGSTIFHREMQDGGAETGSTRAVKVLSGVRHCIRRYRAKLTNANDNFAFVAANDNSVVEGEGRIAA